LDVVPAPASKRSKGRGNALGYVLSARRPGRGMSVFPSPIPTPPGHQPAVEHPRSTCLRVPHTQSLAAISGPTYRNGPRQIPACAIAYVSSSDPIAPHVSHLQLVCHSAIPPTRSADADCHRRPVGGVPTGAGLPNTAPYPFLTISQLRHLVVGAVRGIPRVHVAAPA